MDFGVCVQVLFRIIARGGKYGSVSWLTLVVSMALWFALSL